MAKPARKTKSSLAETGVSLRDRIQQQIGAAPIKDSLGAVTWMQRVLAISAAHMLESGAEDKEKIAGLLKIADRMAKLRDIDRLH